MTLEGLIWAVVYVLVVCAIAYGLTYLVRSAPFIIEPVKSILVWVIWAIVILLFLLWLVRHLGPGTRLW